MATSERNILAGGPSKRLTLRVRAQLGLFGIRPRNPEWALCWEWAYAVAKSYDRFGLSKDKRTQWPQVDEIAAQYMVLLLSTMQSRRSLKLPFRAKHMTPAVAAALPKKLPEVLRLTEQQLIDSPALQPLTLEVS